MAGWASGILSGLGGEAAQMEQGRQRRVRENLAERAQRTREQEAEAYAESERARADAERFREQLSTRTRHLGEPWRGTDGKMYAWTEDPSGKIGVTKLDIPGPASPIEELMQAYETLVRAGFSKEQAWGATLGKGKAIPEDAYAKEFDKEEAELDFYLAAKKKSPEYAKALLNKLGGGGRAHGGGDYGGIPETTLKHLAEQWTERGIKPPAKFQVAVQNYIAENEMDFKRKLGAQEQRILDVVRQAEPKVRQLKAVIEKNNLQGDNDWVFGSYSVLMQHLRKGGYTLGKKPDQVAADMIKSSAALQVMGAAPWMTMSRGKYMYETVVQHLPRPTDTPGLLYDKLNFLETILDEAKASLAGGQGVKDFTAPDAAADEYLKNLGVR